MGHTELGKEVLDQFLELLGPGAMVEKAPKLEGRNMFTILAKKSDK